MTTQTINGKQYIEVSYTELEEIRLELEIQRQIKTGRASRTKHNPFHTPADSHHGKKLVR